MNIGCQSTGTDEANVAVKNTLCEGRLVAAGTGRVGVWDQTNKRYLIFSSASEGIVIPLAAKWEKVNFFSTTFSSGSTTYTWTNAAAKGFSYVIAGCQDAGSNLMNASINSSTGVLTVRFSAAPSSTIRVNFIVFAL